MVKSDTHDLKQRSITRFRYYWNNKNCVHKRCIGWKVIAPKWFETVFPQIKPLNINISIPVGEQINIVHSWDLHLRSKFHHKRCIGWVFVPKRFRYRVCFTPLDLQIQQVFFFFILYLFCVLLIPTLINYTHFVEKFI